MKRPSYKEIVLLLEAQTEDEFIEKASYLREKYDLDNDDLYYLLKENTQ